VQTITNIIDNAMRHMLRHSYNERNWKRGPGRRYRGKAVGECQAPECQLSVRF